MSIYYISGAIILKIEIKPLFLCDSLIFKHIMHLSTTKLPKDCKSKEEIRQQIDLIDKEIIALFARRFEYVSEIVKFKNDAESVVAQDRKNEVIELRGKWAEESGLDKDTFEQIYRFLVDHNIKKEMEILEKR
jgi:isochorismate pyruvate lyase